MKFILARKLKMSQRYDAAGRVIPVTAVEAGPCVVLQVKNKETDGYAAIQVAFGKMKKATMPEVGHQKGLAQPGSHWRNVREFRTEDKVNRGDMITTAVFQPGDVIQVEGVTKGKGFAGVVKRHHFHGHPTTHGHKDAERMPGGIGAGGHQHVDKGRRMAGRMGNDNLTIKNLQVVEIDAAKNILFIKGPVPGAFNALLMISGPGEMKLEPMKNMVEKSVATPAAPVVSQPEVKEPVKA